MTSVLIIQTYRLGILFLRVWEGMEWREMTKGCSGKRTGDFI